MINITQQQELSFYWHRKIINFEGANFMLTVNDVHIITSFFKVQLPPTPTRFLLHLFCPLPTPSSQKMFKKGNQQQ